MHLVPMTERICRFTLGPDCVRLKEYLKVVNPKAVDREGNTTGAETLLIHYLLNVGMYRVE